MNQGQHAVAAERKYAWIIMVIVFLAASAGPAAMFAIAPVVPILMADTSLGLTTMGQVGTLMSVFFVISVILAFPGGFIAQKWGLKTVGLIALASIILGSVIAALSSGVSMLMVGRVIQGIGMGFFGVSGPAAISVWFAKEKRGLPMGVFAAWVPFAILVMSNTAPAIGTTFGWQGVFWSVAGYGIVMFILWAILFRMPRVNLHGEGAAAEGMVSDTRSMLRAVKNPHIWLLGIGFGLFGLVQSGIIASFYPTFLNTVAGYPLATAASIASVITLITVFAEPASGFISDKLHSRKIIIIVPALFLAGALWFGFSSTSTAVMWTFVAFAGVFGAGVSCGTWTLSPEIMGKAELAAVATAVIAFCQNIGMLLGSPIYGVLLDSFGWTTATRVLAVPVMASIAVFGWFVGKRGLGFHMDLHSKPVAAATEAAEQA